MVPASSSSIRLTVIFVFCSLIVGQFYSGLVPCISHRGIVFTDSEPCIVPGDFQLFCLL